VEVLTAAAIKLFDVAYLYVVTRKLSIFCFSTGKYLANHFLSASLFFSVKAKVVSSILYLSVENLHYTTKFIGLNTSVQLRVTRVIYDPF
jgi:hypothetical protein